VKQVDNLDRHSEADFRAILVITGDSDWRRLLQPGSDLEETQRATFHLPIIHGDDVSLGGLWQRSRTFERTEHLPVPVTAEIRIALQERDRFLWQTFNHTCDISPAWGARSLHISYSWERGITVAGYESGRVLERGIRGQMFHVRGEGDNKRAEIWFTIT
jgi:hypothetical protein